ncbi:MAG: DNA repair protein RecN [Cyclobacteriaceae bacterium]|nr:DNA repair protein RecN [Cyclobacteriaceae bacterium]
MINSLSIRNYALIQELDLTPSSSLNIITGETGAGKSIMLGALGLLLGNRADTRVLWDDTQKCQVEGVFDIETYQLQDFFASNDLDYEPQCIIRREISPNGKSRAFINDVPATLDILRQIGAILMDIHSQHESLQLGNNEYQLDILDTFAGNYSLVEDYQKEYQAYKQALATYNQLRHKASESKKEEDYQRFVFQELCDARLDDLDQEALESELSLLENAEEIKLKISDADQYLDRSEFAVLAQLKETSLLFRNLQKLSEKFGPLYERLESVSIELKDLHTEIVNLGDGILLDPERQEDIKNRLDLLYRLQQKHKIDSVAGLIELRNQVDRELQTLDNLDEDILHAKQEMENREKHMCAAGSILSEARKKAAPDFSARIVDVIQPIGIENGQVIMEVNALETPGEKGLDQVSLLFSANKGISPRELKDVASGGEFSRLIFAIKYLIADKTAMPTIVFDEIDTGISGEIALKMVRMMRKMAENHQVIAISHLPQIAAGGDRHYFVYKDHSNAKTFTKIKQLLEHERIEAIAQMIGGEKPTRTAYESARELLVST